MTVWTKIQTLRNFSHWAYTIIVGHPTFPGLIDIFQIKTTSRMQTNV